MKETYVFLADGFEEVEALTCVDVLRRAGMPVTTVSINPGLEVTGAHGVTVLADSLYDDNDYADAEWLVLPGGMPGATNLASHEALCRDLTDHNARGGRVAAICASPAVVLAPLGILEGKKATCYPGFEQALEDAKYTGDLVTVDGNVTTGEGPAAAFPYAYELLSQLAGKGISDQIAEGMRFKHLMA